MGAPSLREANVSLRCGQVQVRRAHPSGLPSLPVPSVHSDNSESQ